MPWRSVTKRERCLGCRGMRGHWIPPVYNSDHPELSLPTTWVDCGICNGNGHVNITELEWYPEEKDENEDG